MNVYTKPSFATFGTLLVSAIAMPSYASLISNGDLEISVGNTLETGGDTAYTVDGSDNITNGGDSGFDVNQWVDSALTRAFVWSATGGNGGTGGFVSDGVAGVERPRAALFFARDDKATTGNVDISIDINLSQASQFFYVELYAWDSDETAPSLSMGGPTPNGTNYNVTTLGGADALLTATADTATLNSWQTLSLGSVNLGSGHDYYAWRVGVVGATNATFAFDNLVVVPEPGSLALLGLGGLLIARRRRG